MPNTWTVTVEFQADSVDDAHMLRELLATMAENSRGITEVDVTAQHPEGYAWVNLSGRPGDGRLINLADAL